MDVDSKPLSHHEDISRATNNETGNWHERLRLRKPTSSSLTVKSVTEEEKITTVTTEKPSLNKHEHDHTMDNLSSKLTFTCSECKDSTMFSPSGLLNHFKVFHEGKGNPPSFPCDICSFATPEFSSLQQHRMKKHRNCKLVCDICNDNIFHTSSQLTTHCKTKHRLNGQYHCGKCKFSTKKVKNFMHHACSNGTTPPTDSAEKADVKPINGELNRNNLTDTNGAAQKEELLKHMATACHQRWSRKNWWRKKEFPPKQHNSNIADYKLLLPKQETPWSSSALPNFSAAGLLDENGILINPARTLEETQQFLERTVNLGKDWSVTLKGEPELASLSPAGPLPLQAKTKQCSTVPGLRNPVKNKLSGLMEKNNISVPPDCTTKVVGFKMVDGKKHLVLKVIPSPAKTEVSQDTEQSPGLNVGELNRTESGSLIKRASDQTGNESGDVTTKNPSLNSYDATSGSDQPEKERSGISTDVPQVHNTENDCNNDNNEFVDVVVASAQLNVSGTEERCNGANQGTGENGLTSPDVTSNKTYHLHGNAADASEEVRSARQTDIQPLHKDLQEAECPNKHADCLKEAVTDSLERHSGHITNHDVRGCRGDQDSSVAPHLGTLEKGLNPQVPTLLSEEDGNPILGINGTDMKSGENTVGVQSPLLTGKLQSSAVVNSPTNQEECTFELNGINPTLVSPHKHTTESLFNSPSEDGELLFQDSGSEYTNSIDPGDALVPLDQNSTTETVEESSDLAVSSLGDSCHNTDLFQTLEELPVTTVNHLLDDPDTTFKGGPSQLAELGDLSTQQVALYPCNTIPVPSKVTAEDFSQSDVCSASADIPAMTKKRRREPTTEDSEEPVIKPRRQRVQKLQGSSSPAPVRYWEPVPKGGERTLRLLPFSSSQPVKVPHLNQPVVVLNHPDIEIPEVSNIMRAVHRHQGAVQRVVLSQGTLEALSGLSGYTSSPGRRVRPPGTVKEKFVLKMTLKRVRGSKFKVVSPSSKTNRSIFRCWFCGRPFRHQKVWVNHGQRHLMEATRDWNEIFNNERAM